MILKYKHKAVNWTDISSPEKEEIRFVFEDNNIPLSFLNLIKNETKEEDYIEKDGSFVSVFAVDDKIENNLVLIKNQDLIITIHNKDFKSFKKIANNLEIFISSLDKNINLTNDIVFNAIQKTIISDILSDNYQKSLKIKNLIDLCKRKDFYFYVLFSLTLIIIIALYVTIFI